MAAANGGCDSLVYVHERIEQAEKAVSGLKAENELQWQSALGESMLEAPRDSRPLRRASDRTPLGSILGRIERAYADGAYTEVVELVEKDPIAVWYGLPPARLGVMVEKLRDVGVPEGRFLGVLSRMLAGAPDWKPEDASTAEDTSAMGASSVPEASTSSGAGGVVETALWMFGLRLQGRPVESLARARELESVANSRVQLIFDGSRGWALFNAVQYGITAMLAGEFGLALTRFTEARMHAEVPPLVFLVRDACVKSAVIEALYGDQRRARTLLDDASRIARTESWAEEVIDVGVTIAEASLLVERPAEAVRMLGTVPLQEIGEMWPFYLEALHRSLLLAGNIDEAKRQRAMFEQLPLPRVEGQGFTGSVLLYCDAQTAMMQGDATEARDRLERADDSVALTHLLAATLDLSLGRPRAALTRLDGAREQTEGLRLLNLLRLSILAGGKLTLGARDECRETLAFVLKNTPGLTSWEALNFPVEVRAFAEAELEDWPRAESETKLGLDTIPARGDVLTIREQELLRELSSGLTREQIAKNHFISINTLKAHLRSIYRKLEVSSRAAAILEAGRRGLV